MARPEHQIGIQAWVESILDPLGFTPSIFSDEGGVRPIPPYASINMLSDVARYQPEQSSSYDAGEDELTNSIKLTRDGTFDVAIMGDGHNSAAHELIANTSEQASLDLLYSYGLSIKSTASNQTLSTDSDGVTETRSIISFDFGWAYLSEKTTSEFIEETIITGSVS
jgi:hypothetical protein